MVSPEVVQNLPCTDKAAEMQKRVHKARTKSRTTGGDLNEVGVLSTNSTPREMASLASSPSEFVCPFDGSFCQSPQTMMHLCINSRWNML